VNAGFRGDVGERSVAVIVVKSGLRRLGRMEERRVAAIHKKNVQEAILVIVEPAHACSHGFQVQLLIGSSAFVAKVNAGSFGDVAELNVGRICDGRTLTSLCRRRFGGGPLRDRGPASLRDSNCE
jgi:hypothetical protein